MRSELEKQYVRATQAHAAPPRAPVRSESMWRDLNVWTGLATVGGTAVCCGLIGTVLGAGMALLIPDYYRAVFGAVDDPSFEPLAVGLGLGLTQGTIGGLVVGCVVILSVAIYSRRPNY
jgi:hypothetical protein